MPMDQMGMGDEMPTGGGGPPPDAGAPAPAPAEGEQQGPSTIFLSKEVLGGKVVKEGDTGTVTIVSVDPETGDAEASVTIGGAAEGGEGDINAAFDRAMPPEQGEGGY